MNIITSPNIANAVSLKELIPEHESLKLLILHTPFNIEISSLPQCLNLVKLDLSKNNIQSFPYLGHLHNLKIMFIHENHLTINQFISVFEREGEASALSGNIVWITYWGNRNVFLARHYTANRTKAIAFDKNMITDEEKMGDLSTELACFTPATDISEFFMRRNLVSTHTTEEEYMQDFWASLRTLRRKHEELHPIIKVQKVFRGWVFRERVRREFLRERERYLLQLNCFGGWRGRVGKEKKLARVLALRKKAHLLFPLAKITREYIYQRMRDLARQARDSVLKRRLLLHNELKFYSVLRNNFLALQDLYACLLLSSSAAVYIHSDSVDPFVRYVVPFVANFTSEPVEHSLNDCYHLHSLHPPRSTSELIRVLQANLFSVVSHEKPLEKMLQVIRFKKPTHLEAKMRAVLGKCHLTRQQRERMAEQERGIEQTKKLQRDRLVRIAGSAQLLRTIARGVFFYNQGRLSLPAHPRQRVFLFSEGTLRRISSAITIQRAWRGYIFRKKNEGELRIILLYQKAAITIQRWFRRVPLLRKKLLLFEAARSVAQFEEPEFLVEFEDYRERILGERGGGRHIMLEQHSRMYRHRERGELVLSWDDRCGNPTVGQLVAARKTLFSKVLLRQFIALPDEDLAARTLYSPGKLEQVPLPHLFHHQTQTSLVSKQDKKYVLVRCTSKAETQFRVFCLAVLTFDFRAGRGVRVRRGGEGLGALVGAGEKVIVCNQSLRLVKTVEQCVCKQQFLSVYMISNRVFLPVEPSRKPFKVEEKFFVYMVGFPEEPQRMTSPQRQQSGSLAALRAKEEVLQVRMYGAGEQLGLRRERKIMVKKRSIRQFNCKLSRRDKKQPNFIIDNKSSERSHQSQLPSSHRQQQEAPKAGQQRRKGGEGREEEGFTKRFVNMGNFIQSQQLQDQRRRIKTDIKEAAQVSHEEVRSSEKRGSEHRKQRMGEKVRRARELEAVHRSLVEHHRLLTEEHGIVLRSNVSLSKEGRGERRRRPKVSFAEESFPLIYPKQRNASFQ